MLALRGRSNFQLLADPVRHAGLLALDGLWRPDCPDTRAGPRARCTRAHGRRGHDEPRQARRAAARDDAERHGVDGVDASTTSGRRFATGGWASPRRSDRRLAELERPESSTSSDSATSSARSTARLGAPTRRPVRLRRARDGPADAPQGRTQARGRQDDLPTRCSTVRCAAHRRLLPRARRLPRRRHRGGAHRPSGRSGFRRRHRRRATRGPAPRARARRCVPLVLSSAGSRRARGSICSSASLPGLEGRIWRSSGPSDRGTADAADPPGAGARGSDRVHMTGGRGRARPRSRLYSDADVFALASEYESFGMVAAEAAAAGTAAIVTDRCGVAEPSRGRRRARRALRGGRWSPRRSDGCSATRRCGAARRERSRGRRRVVVAAGRRSCRKDSTAGCSQVADLAIVGQDPGFAGGGLAQTEALWRAAVALGRSRSSTTCVTARLDSRRREARAQGPRRPPTRARARHGERRSRPRP